MPMAQFGLIPDRKDSLFRIVWAPSVLHLVGGEFSDGFIGYRARPSYRHIGEKWILEKWISAYDCTKMDEPTYNAEFKNPETGLCITGPYPRNGTYFHCHTFDGIRPNINIPLLVALIKKAKFNDPRANQRAIVEAQQAAENADFKARFDKMKDLQSVGGIRPANIGGRVKKQKSFGPLRDAASLGLPTRGVKQIQPTERELAVAGF
jgi:hypothetical protein